MKLDGRIHLGQGSMIWATIFGSEVIQGQIMKLSGSEVLN